MTSPTNDSGLRDNHTRGTVADFLRAKTHHDSRLSVVSAYFTIYAYDALKDVLNSIDHLDFLFGEPSFVNRLDPSKTVTKSFLIDADGLELANKLQQKRVARECADWIERKVDIKTIKQSNQLHGKMYQSSRYKWLTADGGEWPQRLRSYLRAAEERLTREGHLPEGTLTMFDGFRFSPQNPYTYGEAKRLLKLAMIELKKDKSLIAIGMDPKAPGRPAITGKGEQVVWDFLSLIGRPSGASFTAYPHLTLGVHADHLLVAVSVPNGVVRPVKRRLMALGPEQLVEINRKILLRARPLLKLGAGVFAHALQRHYLSQRSVAAKDAMLSFRLETSVHDGKGPVKHQPEWVHLFADLARRKRSNIQFQYQIQMPWD